MDHPDINYEYVDIVIVYNNTEIAKNFTVTVCRRAKFNSEEFTASKIISAFLKMFLAVNLKI